MNRPIRPIVVPLLALIFGLLFSFAACAQSASAEGDSWDYVGISPATSEAQDDHVDKIASSKGMSTGFKAGLELRTMLASHTDTYARGPTSAEALVNSAK